MDLNLQLFNQIKGNFSQVGKIDFYIEDTTYGVEIIEHTPYKLNDIDLAHAMIKSTLKRLQEQKVFLSGWKIYEMNYPNFKIHDN